MVTTFKLYLSGLRVSVLVTSTLVCLGCGLRCITTNPNQATWYDTKEFNCIH